METWSWLRMYKTTGRAICHLRLVGPCLHRSSGGIGSVPTSSLLGFWRLSRSAIELPQVALRGSGLTNPFVLALVNVCVCVCVCMCQESMCLLALHFHSAYRFSICDADRMFGHKGGSLVSLYCCCFCFCPHLLLTCMHRAYQIYVCVLNIYTLMYTLTL